MGDLVKKNTDLLPLNMKEVEERISVIRNQEVIADADVAFLYGVVPPRHSRSAVYTCWQLFCETESSLEINFIIGKIKHTVKRVRREDPKK